MHRRQFITGLISLVAAPAIVRAASLMPVRRIPIWSNTFYVNGAYEGLSDGSLLRPWMTLQQAMDYIGQNIVFDAVTVHVGPGNYAGFEYRTQFPTSNVITIKGSGTGYTFVEK